MIVGWLISCVDVPAQLVVVSAQIFVDVRDILADVMLCVEECAHALPVRLCAAAASTKALASTNKHGWEREHSPPSADIRGEQVWEYDRDIFTMHYV